MSGRNGKRAQNQNAAAFSSPTLGSGTAPSLTLGASSSAMSSSSTQATSAAPVEDRLRAMLAALRAPTAQPMRQQQTATPSLNLNMTDWQQLLLQQQQLQLQHQMFLQQQQQQQRSLLQERFAGSSTSGPSTDQSSQAFHANLAAIAGLVPGGGGHAHGSALMDSAGLAGVLLPQQLPNTHMQLLSTTAPSVDPTQSGTAASTASKKRKFSSSSSPVPHVKTEGGKGSSLSSSTSNVKQLSAAELPKVYKRRYQQKRSIKRKLLKFEEATGDLAMVVFVTRNSQRREGCDIEWFVPALERQRNGGGVARGSSRRQRQRRLIEGSAADSYPVPVFEQFRERTCDLLQKLVTKSEWNRVSQGKRRRGQDNEDDDDEDDDDEDMGGVEVAADDDGYDDEDDQDVDDDDDDDDDAVGGGRAGRRGAAVLENG